MKSPITLNVKLYLYNYIQEKKMYFQNHCGIICHLIYCWLTFWKVWQFSELFRVRFTNIVFKIEKKTFFSFLTIFHVYHFQIRLQRSAIVITLMTNQQLLLINKGDKEKIHKLILFNSLLFFLEIDNTWFQINQLPKLFNSIQLYRQFLT